MSNTIQHLRADLMFLYATDAKTTDKPWTRWQKKVDGEWVQCETHPAWDDAEYRRCRVVITVGKHSFIKGETEPLTIGTSYFYIAYGQERGFYDYSARWQGLSWEMKLLEHGLVHLSMENAQQHAKVLNAVSLGDI